MPYCQLYYHLVWTTKERRPLLVPEIAEVVYGFIRSKTIGLEGKFFALNGVADHIHLVVSIPAKIAVATFVGQVKGVSSARFNREHPNRETLLAGRIWRFFVRQETPAKYYQLRRASTGASRRKELNSDPGTQYRRRNTADHS
jgi:REP element-mobilizing transposase RayT